MTGAYDQLRDNVADLSQAEGEPRNRGRNRDWCLFGAVVGLSGGLAAALIGSLLTAVAWLTVAGAGLSYARPLGTMLLIITIPLLISGAHCLDLMDRRKDRRRESRFGREQ